MPPQTTRRPSLDIAALAALIAIIVIAAFIATPWNAVPVFSTKAFFIGAGAIVALALYILARLSRGSIVLPPALPLALLALPALAYLLSAAFSGNGFAASTFGTALESDTFGFVLAATVLGLLCALVLRRASDLMRALRVLAIALGVLIALQVLALIVGQFAPSFISPAYSLAGSLSEMGALSGLGLVLGLVTLRALPLSPRARLALSVLGAFELVMLALADSTLLWIIAALSGLALFVEAVMRRSASGAPADDLEGASLVAEEAMPTGERPLVAPLAVLAVALFFLIGSSLGNGLVSALNVSALSVRPSWQSTLATGGATYRASPVFGSGPGTFGARWLLSRNPSINLTAFSGIDFTSGIGFVPTSFVTTGIVGLLAWLLFLGGFLYLAARVLIFRAPEDPAARYAALAAFAGFAYLAVLAIFSVPGPFTLALLFVFAGLFASAARYGAGAGQWGVVFGRSPRVGFLIVFCLTLLLLASIAAAYALVGRYIAVADLARAQSALAAGDYATASAAAARSVSFAPTAPAYEAEALAALGQLQAVANDTSLSQSKAQQQFQSYLSAGIAAALAATKLAPADYTTWLSLGNLYAAVVPLNVSGAYTSASQAYAKAAAEDPTSPAIPYLEAELEIADKNTAAAEADLKKAIALQASDTQAILLLSQLEVSTGDLKTALADAQAAAYFTPNDPNVLFEIGVLQAASGDLPDAIDALTSAVAAEPSFANARYLLAAALAKTGDYQGALAQIQAIADLSAANKQAVAADLAALSAGKNPFPANLLAATSTTLTE